MAAPWWPAVKINGNATFCRVVFEFGKQKLIVWFSLTDVILTREVRESSLLMTLKLVTRITEVVIDMLYCLRKSLNCDSVTSIH